MDKRQVHHRLSANHWAKPTYFLGVAVVSSAVCLIALRANNQHMISLRDAVYVADKNDTDVQKPLRELQLYVTSHMNTDLTAGNTSVYPPIQLKYTYDRLVRSQSDATTAANAALYTAAQQYCEQQNSTDVSGRNRVPCIEQYVQTHQTAKTAVIPDALYKFAFVTPRWSPDLAGWSMVAAVTSAVLAVALFVLRRWSR